MPDHNDTDNPDGFPTDAKPTEASAQRFAELCFAHSLHLVLIARVNGRIERCNRAWRDVLGWEPDDLVGKSFLGFVHPDDLERTRHEAGRLGAGQETKYFENRYRHSDGRWRTLAWSAVADPSARRIYAIAHDISDQREATTALMHQRQQMRGLMAVSPVGVFHAGTDGRITNVNRCWTDITGLSEHQSRGDGWLYAVHPDDHARVATHWRQVVAERAPLQEELRFQASRDRDVWVLARVEPERGVDGVHTGFVGTITDITDLKAAQAALQHSREHFRAVVQDTPLLICRFQQSGLISFVNRAYADYFGTTAEALEGTSFLDAIPEAEQRQVWRNIQALSLAAPQSTHEHRARTSSGELRWQRWTSRALFDAAGELLGYQSVGEDITEGKRQRHLLTLEARRAEVLLALPRLAEDCDEAEFLQRGLALAEDITGSSVGHAHLVIGDEQQLEALPCTRHALDARRGPAPATPDLEAATRLWTDALHHREPVVVNDCPAAGIVVLLAEDAPLVRALTVPVLERGQVVMLICVGNKATDYQDIDVRSVQLLANALWRITQRDRDLARLRLAERVLHDTAEGIAITDPDGNLVAVNPAFERITGYREDEVRGSNLRTLSAERDEARFYGDLWAALKTNGQWRGEVWNRRKNGEIYPQWLSISAVHDARQHLSHYVGVLNDISDIKAAQERIDYLARHDALTGLPNRASFLKQLEQALQQALGAGKPLAVLLIDIDRFNLVNDSLGHRFGDRILVAIGDRLLVRRDVGDVLARLSADEFALLRSRRAGASDAAELAASLLADLRRPLTLNDQELFLTASIGISLFPDDADDAERLVRYADRALDAAKGSGRNGFRFFTQTLKEGARNRLILENALRGAVARDELRLAFQPQVALHSGALAGAEALVRWQHPTLGELSPAEFIPVAEEIGAIGEIGLWALDAACRQLATWDAAGFHLPLLAVNLSVQQLERPGFVDEVADALTRHDVPAARFELEVTESMLIRDPDAVRETLHALSAIGIRIAVDDFGTGYSNLALLRMLALDRIKIDQSLVRDLGTQPDADAIVRAIVAMAAGLELETIAEGIEHRRQSDWLTREGVAVGQGYWFDQPLEPDKLARKYRHIAAVGD
ncbi:MAG: PAS domain S-box protein [Thiohalocapsa sp.]|uniref:PAS domain S-box protein n=1 Tax=Thiohalocapsa sp. TaxID=2497641 RepID=UPI0025CE1C88|nr:PAS domain S-box protein [Thiohalocapsa sp.]MCG6940513.1 PAS domain S-box protein [Thiohalocapsa sp.]